MNKKNTWESITDTLIEEIANDVFAKDEKLPSENNMAVRFHVPRSEIRRAYSRLKELGYIYSLQGYGSFFHGKREKIRLMLTNEVSFSSKMKELNIPYESKNIECCKISYHSKIYDKLNASKNDSVYKLVRLRILYNEAAAIHTSYVCHRCFPQIDENGCEITSFFDYMKKNGYSNFSNTDMQMMVSNLSQKERTLLQVSGYESGLILMGKCIDNTTKQVLEVSHTIYRCDKFVFTFD